MLTRCPHCQTCFRVTAEQLKIRQGSVRCGACHAVFDGIGGLCDDAPPARLAEVPPPPQATTESGLPAMPTSIPPPATPAEIVPEPLPEPLPEPTSDSPPEPIPGRPPEPLPNTKVVPGVEEESFPEEWTAPPPPRRWPWVLASLLLVLLGAAQLTYLFRVELAVLAPELRPTLLAACEMAGCTLPHPRRPELTSIESSDLIPVGTNRLRLVATLKNRAPFAQEIPHLELTLTDTRDAVIVRRVLSPADWLPEGQDATAFPARGELAVDLSLTTPALPAVGYRLYLFYP